MSEYATARWESKCKTCGRTVTALVPFNMQHPRYVENALHIAHREACTEPDFVSFLRAYVTESADLPETQRGKA